MGAFFAPDTEPAENLWRGSLLPRHRFSVSLDLYQSSCNIPELY